MMEVGGGGGGGGGIASFEVQGGDTPRFAAATKKGVESLCILPYNRKTLCAVKWSMAEIQCSQTVKSLFLQCGQAAKMTVKILDYGSHASVTPLKCSYTTDLQTCVSACTINYCYTRTRKLMPTMNTEADHSRSMVGNSSCHRQSVYVNTDMHNL